MSLNLIPDAGVFEESNGQTSAKKSGLNLVPDAGIYSEISPSSKKASSGLAEYGKNVLKATSRVGGIAAGVMNSPLAFVWGGMAERERDPESFDKLPTWKQSLVSVGAGFDSAWRSTTKKGDWGTLYGEYYKQTTGKTIEEDLPDSLKWSAPTVEFLANIVSDPLIGSGVAKNLARFKVPKGWVGKIPENVVNDLKKFEQLDAVEKQALQGKLSDIFKNRADYMDKWQDVVPFTKQQQKIRDAELIRQRGKIGKLLVQEVRETKITQPLERQFKGEVPVTPEDRGAILGKLPVEPEPPVKHISEVIKEKWEKQIENARKAIIAKQSSKGMPLIQDETDVILKSEMPNAIKEFGIEPARKSIPGLAKLIKEQKMLGKIRHPSREPESVLGKIKTEEFRKQKGLPVTEGMASKQIEAYKTKLATQKIDEFRKSKGLPPLQVTKASGGAILGIEEDEQGNITYNVEKGLTGALAVAGVKSINIAKGKKFAETLARNPAWAKVHGMIGKESSSFSLAGIWAKAHKNIFDRFAPLKKLTEATYTAARTFHSFKDEAAMKFNELKESFKPVKDSEVVMSDYIDAHRAYTRAMRGIENPNSVTSNDAMQAIREIEKEWLASGKKIEDLRESFNGFQDWTHKYILKEALDNGIISKASYDDIVKNNKFYATFDVLDHMPEDLHKIPTSVSGEYFSVANQNIIKGMTGTRKLIRNPIDATINKFVQAQATFAKNKVASIFVDDPAVKGLLRPIATSKKEFANMKNQGLNPVMEGAWSKKEFGTINRFKDGKIERYLTPKELADTMKQLTPWQAPRVIQAYNAIFRASATTLNLAFSIGNSSRDAFMAFTTVPIYKTRDILGKFQMDWAKGAWQGIKHEFLNKPSLVEDYLKSGGGFGYQGKVAGAEAFEAAGMKLSKAALFERSKLAKAGNIIRSPLTLAEKINSVIEMAPRLGTFERAQKLGYTSKDAAFMARQSTIDFNRGGVWTKVANQFVPFLNARIQARVVYAQALKKDTKNTLAKTFTSMVVPGAAAYAWNRTYYSKYYDDIPEYIKQNYFTLIYDTEKNKEGKTVPKYFVIAKGDVGQMAWNPIEFGLDHEWKKNPKEVGKFLINYLSDLSPIEFAREGKVSISKTAGGLVPPILKGPAEDWANLKFYQGTEVVPYWMGKTKPAALQYKENTPATYKWLGEKLDISPLRLQNYASNVLTQYGREGLDPSAMWRGLSGRIVKTTAGDKERQAWIVIKDIENGYIDVRANAEEMIKDGKRGSAIRLMNLWDRGLNKQVIEYNKRFKGELRDKGGLRKSYSFTIQKRKNLLRSKPQKRAIQKRLSVK